MDIASAKIMHPQNLTTTLLLALLLTLVSLGCAGDAETPVEATQPTLETPALTVPEIAEIALKSTVYLRIRNAQNEIFSGSGFVVGDSLIATTYHQIDDIHTGSTARLVNELTDYPIQAVVAVDVRHDLAIIKASDIKAPPLPLGDSNEVRIGEPVHVTGNPDGYIGSFSSGVISGIREGDKFVADKVIQMTCPVSVGSSGGPVLNYRGEVIGVVNGDDSDGQNLNFASPVNFLKELIAGL